MKMPTLSKKSPAVFLSFDPLNPFAPSVKKHLIITKLMASLSERFTVSVNLTRSFEQRM